MRVTIEEAGKMIEQAETELAVILTKLSKATGLEYHVYTSTHFRMGGNPVYHVTLEGKLTSQVWPEGGDTE